MEYYLYTDKLSIVVSSRGAELRSVKDRFGKERLFQGEKEFWSGRSPLLFPFIARLNNNSYKYKKNIYSMRKHGFARDKEFTLVNQTMDSISFVLKPDDETLWMYPFDFELNVTYELHSDEIKVKWMVKNNSDVMMPFTIGAHPAFYLPNIHNSYFKFDKIPNRLTDVSSGYFDPKSNWINEVNISSDGYLKIEPCIFSKDTLVFEDFQMGQIDICNEKKNPVVSVQFSSPVVALWQPNKKNCPFVCVEPWWGLCDEQNYEGDIRDRKWEQFVEFGSTKEYSYIIKLI